MGFSAPFIARPVATILLAIGLLLAGAVAYRFLPVSALPSVDIPTIVVMASRPGADPETMANSIAAPLERRLGEISGVTEITSTSSIGSTAIVIQFDYSRDIDGAAHDVQAAINAATVDLPSDLPTRPYYRKINPADAPILTLALTSATLSAAQIYDAADTVLAQRLSQVEGVSQVTVNGAEKPAVRVQLDPVRLAAAGLAAQDVYTAIRGANVLEPTGGFQGSTTAETIGINGQLSQAAGYAPLVLKSSKGVVVRLSDVATVINGVANSRLAAWNGKQPAILLNVTKEAGANVIDTVDRVQALLPQLLSWMPPDIKLTVIADRTTTIRASVEDVQYTLLITIALVLLVVLVFMRRLMPTLAAAVTVPLSICGTLAGMWFLGYSLDNFSLMALTISVGFVVDDAIVMIENIHRHREKGLSPLQAALVGARQIGFTVMSISLSLVAVFIPLIFMGGILGKLFHEFAMTLTIAIAVSAVVSLTLTPMICGRFIAPGAMDAPGPRGLWGRIDRLVERAFTAGTAFLRTHPWLGAAASGVHAAGHGRHHRRDDPALRRGAQGLPAGAGHRTAHRLGDRIARRVVPGDVGAPARRGRRGPDRSGGAVRRLHGRGRERLAVAEPRHPLHQPQAARGAARLGAGGDRAAARAARQGGRRADHAVRRAGFARRRAQRRRAVPVRGDLAGSRGDAPLEQQAGGEAAGHAWASPTSAATRTAPGRR